MLYSHLTLEYKDKQWHYMCLKDGLDKNEQIKPTIFDSGNGKITIWCPSGQELVYKYKLIEYIEDQLETYINYHNKILGKLKQMVGIVGKSPIHNPSLEELNKCVHI